MDELEDFRQAVVLLDMWLESVGMFEIGLISVLSIGLRFITG
jgi:hypothetical protein